MGQYLIDTNIVSDYFTSSISSSGMLFMSSVIDATPHLSIITQIELLCWKAEKNLEHKIANFITDSIILDIDTEVVDFCVKIRKNKKIKTPDAIIAATALANKYILITNNENDFKNINGLKIINPHKL